MAGVDSSLDIADSSDWLNTPLAPFAQIESALRCQVCKDFCTTPMITSCSHTFCSICIRRALSSDHKCPTCRRTGQESQLRRNVALEELVEAFKNARTDALSFARQSTTIKKPNSPKRKLETSEVDEDLGGDRPSKRTRLSRSSSRRTTESAEAAEKNRITISLLDDGNDGDYVPDMMSTRSPPPNRRIPPGSVVCPVCDHIVKELEINQHLDNDCPPKQRSSTLTPNILRSTRQSSSSKAVPPQKLAYLNFNSMKEHALKKKMKDLGIPDSGTKMDMQNRYTEWMSIWNANCDAAESSKNQRSVKELKADLDTWERTQGSLAPRSGNAIAMGLSIKDENFDGSGWATKHQDEFSDLIAKARQSRLAAKPILPPPSELPPTLPSLESIGPAGSTANQIPPQVPTFENAIPQAYQVTPQVPSYTSPYSVDTQTRPAVSLTNTLNPPSESLENPANNDITPPYPSSQPSHPLSSSPPPSPYQRPAIQVDKYEDFGNIALKGHEG